MRDKYIAGILIILSMAVFITGLNWGLPSEKLNGLYFSKEEHLTKHISELKETELPRFFYNPIRTYHPDEYFILKCLYMIKIPDIFNFSQFSIGGAFLFLYGAILFILYKLNFISITKDIAFYFLHPEKIARMYIVGRFICVLYGTGIVILTYFLTKKIFKSKIAGFFSSFLLIFSPLFLLNAHYMYVDIPGVFWMMILLFFCVKYINGEKINPLIIGFLSGMSAGNKLTFILTFFIPLITFMMAKEEPRKKIKNISLSFLSFSITLFLTTPYLFSALFHLFHAEGKHATKFSFIPGFYILCLRYGLGFPLFLLLLSGLFITFLFERNILNFLFIEPWLLCSNFPYYEKEGKHYLTIAVGCTGGVHRSVAIVEALASSLSEDRQNITVTHRELNRHRVVGADLVANVMNRIAARGAEPLFFGAYLESGHLDPQVSFMPIYVAPVSRLWPTPTMY